MDRLMEILAFSGGKITTQAWLLKILSSFWLEKLFKLALSTLETMIFLFQ